MIVFTYTDIPVEKTGLAGRVHTELNCLPVENAEYQRIMTLKHAEEHKPKNVGSKSSDANLAAILGGGQRTVIDNFIVSFMVGSKHTLMHYTESCSHKDQITAEQERSYGTKRIVGRTWKLLQTI